ncbi:MAG: HAMP domain-containing histidine kinase [Pirellulaceae bacterium]|nr:HAMP domain-containing histidine kinase [Pirellulaceae bacterium]
MPERIEQDDLDQALIGLRADRDSMPWSQRRALAAGLGTALADAHRRDLAVRVAEFLGADPKWEVRLEIARLLSALPDDPFIPLAARLTQDSNGYVRNAAQRAVDQRKKSPGESGGRRRGLDQITSQFDLLGATQGRAVSEKARALAVRLYEASVAATVHDLRGVLTSAKANVTRLRAEAKKPTPDETTMCDGLDKVAHRLAYLEKIVEAMGDYAQTDAADRTPEKLATIVRDAVSVAGDALQSAGFDLTRVKATTSLDEGAIVVVAKHQIVVAIANVLKNAYESVLIGTEATRQGVVHLNAACTGSGQIAIAVRDNGVGLSSVDLQELRAFVPGRTTKKGYGTGFGLPIARRNIAAHDGSISIESSEDAGTTVTIVLPAHSPEEPEE